MENVVLLKDEINKSDSINNNYDDLKLNTDNYSFLTKLLNVLEKEIKTVKQTSRVNRYLYLSNVIEQIDNELGVNKIINTDPIYERLIIISKKLDNIVSTNINNKKLKVLFSNLKTKIDSLIVRTYSGNNIQTPKNAFKDINLSMEQLQTKYPNCKDLVYYLIFDNKNTIILIDYIGNNPLFIKVIRENIKDIIDKLMDKYLQSTLKYDLKNKEYYYLTMIYLTSVKGFNINTFKDKIVDKFEAAIATLKEYSDSNINNYNYEDDISDMESLIDMIDEKNLDKKYSISRNNNIKTDVIFKKYDQAIDMTYKHIFTIDGNYTFCLDDAISIERLGNGNFEVGIYIADLTNIVLPNSGLDEAAMAICQNIYCGSSMHTIMLPPKISNLYSSLNTNGNKAVHAYLFEFDRKGNIVNTSISNAVIKINEQYTYKQIDTIIRELTTPFAKKLRILSHFADKLCEKNSVRKNYVEGKELIEPKKKELPNYDNNNGTKIVDQLKILTNSYLAGIADKEKFPFIYRVNELKTLDIPTNIKEILKSSKGYDNISLVLSSNFGESYYSSENKGNCENNVPAYAHVTTPLRNYSSLFNQRMIQHFVINNDLSDKEIQSLEIFTPLLAEYLNRRIILNSFFSSEKERKNKILVK